MSITLGFTVLLDLSIARNSKNTTFWELDLFPSSGEGAGDTYSVGSAELNSDDNITL
jgi:hypothetical protein